METSYDELRRRFIENEEELKASNAELELAEEEIIKLENQIKESEDHLDNVRKELQIKEDDVECEKGQKTDLKTHVPDCSDKIAKLEIQFEESEVRLHNLQKELKIKEDDLEKEKGQGAKLKTQVSYGSIEIANLMEKLEVAREQLKVSNNERTRLLGENQNRCYVSLKLQCQLKKALDTSLKNEISRGWLSDWGSRRKKSLVEKFSKFEADETKRHLERRKLEAKKKQVNSEIKNKTKLIKKIESRLEEWEPRSKAQEGKLKQSEAEKLKLEEVNASEQMDLQGQISSLKEELDQRKLDVKAVNKEFDKHKKKYRMLKNEKDGANAKIDKLIAEISSGDNQIANMKREILQVEAEQAELISGSEARVIIADELKLKVEELENEVPRQNAVISDTDEEKREAIRQLCISLEHYRDEYEQLLSEFAGHNLHASRAP